MNKVTPTVVSLIVMGHMAMAQFTDVDTAKNHGKTGLKNLTEELDSNFALIEAGSVSQAAGTFTGKVAVNVATNLVDMLIISNSAAEVTGPTMGIRIKYADDGETDADFISCEDNGGDVKFSVGDSGNTVIAGTLNSTGAATITGAIVGNSTLFVTNGATIGGAIQANSTITALGKVQGATLNLSATQWFAITGTTQLVFISGGVTNVIDADITTP